MEYILTAEEMKQCDSYTIEHFHVPSIVLMERAALKCVASMMRAKFDFTRVLVVCGSGNNGGDGYAIARLLNERGVSVDILSTGIITSMSPETRENYESCISYKIPVKSSIRDDDYTLVVDAMFGVGLNRELEKKTIYYIDLINDLKKKGANVVAVDIPSGINASNGKVMGAAVKADMTVTFAYYKKGLMLYPGADYAGKVVLADIGITKESLNEEMLSLSALTKHDLLKADFLKRKNYSNKSTYGKVLLIVGNEEMSGCAVLAATSCFRCGAGMVRVFTHENNKSIISDKLPEAMIDTYDDNLDMNKLSEAVKWSDVIGIGPGIGRNKLAKTIFEFVFFKASSPIVIDADAIHILKQYRMTLKNEKDKDIIITPHIGEMSDFTGLSKSELLDELIENSLDAAYLYNLTCVCKDARTIIASQYGDYRINITGNNGMASAGMGDCLLGIICALRARTDDSFEAASFGAYIHGLAGDLAAEKVGKAGLLATDLINELKTCLEACDE